MIQYFDSLLQTHFNNPNKILQIHSLLTTSGFFLLPKPSKTFAFNCLIQAHIRLKKPNNGASRLFKQMLGFGTQPNHHTFPSLIKSCSSPYTGFAIHGQSIRRGLVFDNFVGCSLIKFYTQLDLFVNAGKVFDEMPCPDLGSCNAVLHVICDARKIDSALEFFEGMRNRDIISWTTIINGFSQNGFSCNAIGLFKRLVNENCNNIVSQIRPNEATLVTILSSCTNLNGSKGLTFGREIHGYIIRTETKLTPYLATSLIDMYGKNGHLNSCENIFQMITNKEICTFNAMIYALACNSQETNALKLFDGMISKQGKIKSKSKLKPNHITFVAVLTACSRAGLVDLGLKLFHSMVYKHNLTLLMEHYGCIVDLLGRAGLLKEAMDFVQKMPLRADVSILGALLVACKLHGNQKLAAQVWEKLLEFESENCGKFITLRNIYAEEGKWSDASEMREKMERAGVKKIAGLSYAQL
ncbi:hypothetical protein LUZ60_009943 [Juncus effusus]|nr:hypothetical protein LUZ60_009943 [Juncus effusus]